MIKHIDINYIISERTIEDGGEPVWTIASECMIKWDKGHWDWVNTRNVSSYNITLVNVRIHKNIYGNVSPNMYELPV